MYVRTRRCSNSSCRPTMGPGVMSPPNASWHSMNHERSTIETALARRFAAALCRTEPERVRIGIEAYTAAFLVVEPTLITSPERRARLAAAIAELIEAGVIKPSRAVDR